MDVMEEHGKQGGKNTHLPPTPPTPKKHLLSATGIQIIQVFQIQIEPIFKFVYVDAYIVPIRAQLATKHSKSAIASK